MFVKTHLKLRRDSTNVPGQTYSPYRVRYLGFCDAVDDGLQRFVTVTFEDSLDTAGSGGESLPHRHAQVVVVLLGCEVLDHSNRKRILQFL